MNQQQTEEATTPCACKQRGCHRLSLGIMVVILSLLSVVAGHQFYTFHQLKKQIGLYAYSQDYALIKIGKTGVYLGKITDVRWNSPPQIEGDVKGFQPRFLIERETAPDEIELRWICTYLVKSSTEPPTRIKASEFPKFRYLKGSLK